jgi:hypothetical protein
MVTVEEVKFSCSSQRCCFYRNVKETRSCFFFSCLVQNNSRFFLSIVDLFAVRDYLQYVYWTKLTGVTTMNPSLTHLLLLIVSILFRGPVAAFLLGFVNIAIGELVIHKYIFHGHWKVSKETRIPDVTTRNPFILLHNQIMKFFNSIFHPFYVQHWLAHHKHVIIDTKHIGEHGECSEHLRLKTLQQYPNKTVSLLNSSMGMGASIYGLIYQYALLVFTPLPYCGLVFWHDKPWSLLTYLLPSLLLPLSTIYHKYLHMSDVSRRKKIPWYFRWLLSDAGDQVVKKHFIHHHMNNDRNWNFIVFADTITNLFDGTNLEPDERTIGHMKKLGLEME